MDNHWDFVNLLPPNISIEIFKRLDDPSDLVRASAASRSWRDFVISTGLCKQLCLRLFPQLSSVSHVELSSKTRPSDVESSNSIESETLMRDHRVYAFLGYSCTSFVPVDCIAEAISASSTDNYPQESIHQTLKLRDTVAQRAFYWSSKGQRNPAVPETLIYKLVSDFCVITEIYIEPFLAYFQSVLPVYSAKSVRFRMGHPKSPVDTLSGIIGEPGPADDKFLWTYTSQQFPMAQESRLQKFKLPEPVLCIGGFLQIELLGRVQKHVISGLFYICIEHVVIVGRSLSPTFDVEILEPSGKFLLKYFPHAQHCILSTSPENDCSVILKRLMNLKPIMRHILRGDFEDLPWNYSDDIWNFSNDTMYLSNCRDYFLM